MKKLLLISLLARHLFLAGGLPLFLYPAYLNGQAPPAININTGPCEFNSPQSPVPVFPQAAAESKNGWKLPAQGTIRILVIFAEVNWDVTNDPYPVGGTPEWPAGQLPVWKDFMFDPNITATPQGIMTQYFKEASFGTYNVIGDYLINPTFPNQPVIINESDGLCPGTVIAAANQFPAFFTGSGFAILDFDNWTLTSDGLAKINPSVDSLPKYDHIMYIFRNSTCENDYSGRANIGSPYGSLFGADGDTYSQFNASGPLPFNIARHEYSHLVYGSNNFHTGGETTSGDYFIALELIWSGMIGASATLMTSNGWDRDRLGWIGPGKTMTISGRDAANTAEVNGDLDASNPAHAGTYLLRDFATTGDALRIKLPFLVNGEFPQYIWIENHRTSANNQTIFDKFQFQQFACVENATPGLYMYLQINKDVKTGGGTYGSHANYLRGMPASGNRDLFIEQVPQQNNCVNDAIEQPFFKQAGFDNPLTGVHGQQNIPVDKDANTITKREGVTQYIEKVGNIFVKKLQHHGTSDMAFTLNGKNKIGVGTNPPTAAVMQLVHNGTPILGEPNNRKIQLNGVSVEITGEDVNGNITVEVRFDDVEVFGNVRWCADEIVLNPVNTATGYSLNLMPGAHLSLDRGLTPTRVNGPLPFNNQLLFNDPTVFTCLPNTHFHMEPNSTLEVINASTLVLEPGSILEIHENSKVIIDDGSTLIVEDGAELRLHHDGLLHIKPGGQLIYKNTDPNKMPVLGNPAFNIPTAEMRIEGRFDIGDNVKFDIQGNGFVHFIGVPQIVFSPGSEIRMDGIGKTDRMMKLSPGALVKLVLHKVDLRDGLIEYGSNATLQVLNTGVFLRNITMTGLGKFGLLGQGISPFRMIDSDAIDLETGVKLEGSSASINLFANSNFTHCGTAIKGNNLVQSTLINVNISNPVSQFSNQGVDFFNTKVVVTRLCTIADCSEGVTLNEVDGYNILGGRIHNSLTGVFGTNSNVFVRSGASIDNNLGNGVEMFGNPNPLNAMLTVGDFGCGSIIENEGDGVFGLNLVLNVDAIEHAINKGTPNDVFPNRFDGNGGDYFDICYTDQSQAPSTILAKGNFWRKPPTQTGVGLPPQVNKLRIKKNESCNITIPVDFSLWEQCIPQNSCEDCAGPPSGPGGGPNNNIQLLTCLAEVPPGDPTIGEQFEDANIPFIAEDNDTTRAGFNHLAGFIMTNTPNGFEACDPAQPNCDPVELSEKCEHLIRVAKILAEQNPNYKTDNTATEKENTIESEEIYLIQGENVFVSIYPNPAKDQLIIEGNFSGQGIFELYDITGRRIFGKNVKGNQTLDISSVSKGLYFYRLVTEQITVKEKIVIQ